MKQHIPLLSCPSSDLPKLATCCAAFPVEAVAAVSYSAVAEHRDMWFTSPGAPREAGSGVIFHHSMTQYDGISDGGSNTLLLAETYRDYDVDLKRWYAANYGDLYCPDARCYLSAFWANANTVTTRWGINRRLSIQAGFKAINSQHAGGGFFGMADGSTRFLGDATDDAVLWSLTTRKPGFYSGEVPVGAL